MIHLPTVAPDLKCVNDNFLIHLNGPEMLGGKFRGDGAHLAEPANFSHRFVHQDRDDAAVQHFHAALKIFSYFEAPDDMTCLGIRFKFQFHSGSISAAAAEADVVGFCGKFLYSRAHTSATRAPSILRDPR